MATETKTLSGVVSEVGFSTAPTVAILDTDDTTWAIATTNNTSTAFVAAMANPSGNPRAGANLQTIKLKVRKFDGTGTPTIRIEVWENGGGAAITDGVSSEIDVTNATEQEVTFTWDATNLTDATGNTVEIHIFGTKTGGSPTVRATVEYDYIAWDVDYSASVEFTPANATLTMTGQAPTVVRTSNFETTPASASLTMTGQVPTTTRTSNFATTPANATLVITGQVPTIEVTEDAGGGIVYAVTSAAANTSGASQSITTSKLGGKTPKLAHVVITPVTALGTMVDGARSCWGWTDGTTLFSFGQTDEHNVADTNTESHVSDSEIIRIFENQTTSAGLTDGKANLSGGGFIADGITINWTEFPAAAYQMVWTFFAGDDGEGYAEILSNIGTTPDTVTSGFNPDFVMGYTGHGAVDSSVNFHYETLGWTDKTAVHSYQWKSRDGQGSGWNLGYLHTTSFLTQINNGSQLVDRTLEISTFTSTTFDLDPTAGETGNDWGTKGTGVAAWNSGTGGVKVLQLDTPVATGNKAYTGAGFEPAFVMIMTGGLESIDTGEINSEAGVFSFGQFDDTDEFCMSQISEDSSGTTDNSSHMIDKALIITDKHGAALVQAEFVSMDADGFTLNFTAVSGTAKRMSVVCFEAVAGDAGLEFTPANDTLVLTGQVPTIVRTSNFATTPGEATLVLTGQVPTTVATSGFNATPGEATLVLTGQVPTTVRTSNFATTPANATLTMTGFAPTVAVSSGGSVEFTPANATLALTGQVPTVVRTSNFATTPANDTLVLTGFAPSVSTDDSVEFTPANDTLTLTGYAVTMDYGITVAAATMVLTGQAPSIAVTTNFEATPANATLTLTGLAPTIQRESNWEAAPASATLVLTGQVPTLVQTTNTEVTPASATLTLTGQAPTVTTTQSPVFFVDNATLTLTGFAPHLAYKYTVPAGSLVLTGYAPTLDYGITVAAATLVLTGYAPSVAVTGSIGFTPANATLAITGQVPTLVQTTNTEVTPANDTLTLTGFAPSVTVSDGLTFTPGNAVLTLTGQVPTILLSDHISAAPANATLTITGQAPSIAVTTNFEATPANDNLVLTGLVPMIVRTSRFNTTPANDTLTIIGQAPTVARTEGYAAVVGNATLVITGRIPSFVVTGVSSFTVPIVIDAQFEPDQALNGQFQSAESIDALFEEDEAIEGTLANA